MTPPISFTQLHLRHSAALYPRHGVDLVHNLTNNNFQYFLTCPCRTSLCMRLPHPCPCWQSPCSCWPHVCLWVQVAPFLFRVLECYLLVLIPVGHLTIRIMCRTILGQILHLQNCTKCGQSCDRWGRTVYICFLLTFASAVGKLC